MYRLSYADCIIRLADGAFIPADPQNPDYQRYQGWVAAGNTPEPADVAPPLNPLQQITALELAKPITHRMLRDLGLATAEIASVITGRPVDDNPAAREIKAMEAQIEGLRQQARAQGLIP